MSSEQPSPSPPPLPWIRSGWFFLGLLAGLGALSWMGWRDGRADFHPNFARIYPAISPETNYYPTLNEMTAIVRARCRKDQVLVIVGGNSILEGVWQPVGDLWSAHLQELLGDRFCVINFAFRGGSPTDGGAVVAEVLRKEYPRQILIANEAPLNGVVSFAHEPYRYIFWQAYFRGLLMDSEARSRDIAEYRLDPRQRAVFIEQAAGAWLDMVLHYRDFWNRVCFDDFCTVPSLLGDYLPKLLTPRRTFKDNEPDAYNPEIRARKYSPASLEVEMNIVRGTTVLYYKRQPDGSWLILPATQEDLAQNYAEAYPRALIPRTLILLSQSSPFYRRRLTPDERERDELGFRDSVSRWRDAGYAAMEYGRDFEDDDFGDRTHLSKTGGRKLAERVAPEVLSLAQRLSYLK